MSEEVVLDITLVRIEKKVRIDGVIYTVKEMTGQQRDQWLNSMGNRMKMSPDGKPSGLKTYDGIQAGLIGLCLYDKDNVFVPIEKIHQWPASAQVKLFDLCQEVNGLNDKAAEEVKNDSGVKN